MVIDKTKYITSIDKVKSILMRFSILPFFITLCILSFGGIVTLKVKKQFTIQLLLSHILEMFIPVIDAENNIKLVTSSCFLYLRRSKKNAAYIFHWNTVLIDVINLHLSSQIINIKAMFHTRKVCNWDQLFTW